MFIRKYFRLTAKLKAFLEVLYFHSPFDCAQTFFLPGKDFPICKASGSDVIWEIRKGWNGANPSRNGGIKRGLSKSTGLCALETSG